MNRRLWLGIFVAFFSFVGLADVRAGLPETIQKNRPAVVLVGTQKSTDNPRFQLRGTGFLIATGQLVVTNAHVLPGPLGTTDGAELVVQTRLGNGDWQLRPAVVLEVDVAHDVALLRMDGPPGVGMVLGDSSKVREGDGLAFMGFPIGGSLGFSVVTHRASVSSITSAALPSPTANRLSERAIRGLRGGTFDIFQLDATAYPGNSGGPLFDPDTGEVLGVMNMVLIKGTRESALSQPSGISYAIPSRYVMEMLVRHQRP